MRKTLHDYVCYYDDRGAERCFTHLEVMSGRINIFNILISSSPGKEK